MPGLLQAIPLQEGSLTALKVAVKELNENWLVLLENFWSISLDIHQEAAADGVELLLNQPGLCETMSQQGDSLFALRALVKESNEFRPVPDQTADIGMWLGVPADGVNVFKQIPVEGVFQKTSVRPIECHG